MSPARDKDKQSAGHGIGVEGLAAEGGKPIDALPEVYGLQGHEDPHVHCVW